MAAERDHALAAAAAAAARLAELGAQHELLRAQLEAALQLGGTQALEASGRQGREDGVEEEEQEEEEEVGGAGVEEVVGVGSEPAALDSLRRRVCGLMAERRQQAGREAALEAACAQLEQAHAALLQQLMQAQSQQQQQQQQPALPHALRGFGGTVTAGRSSGGGALPTVVEDEVCCYGAGFDSGAGTPGSGSGVQAMQHLLAAYASPAAAAAAAAAAVAAAAAALSPHGATLSGCSSGGGAGGGSAFLTRLYCGPDALGADGEGEGEAGLGGEGWGQGSGRLCGTAARATVSGGGGSSLRRGSPTQSFGGAARSASRGASRGGGGGAADADFLGTPVSLSQGSLVRTNPLFMHEGEEAGVEGEVDEGEVDSGRGRDGAGAAAGRRSVVLVGPWAARRGTRSSAGGPADSDSLAYELPLPPPPGASTPLLEALWRRQQGLQAQGRQEEEEEEDEEEEEGAVEEGGELLGEDEAASRFGLDGAGLGRRQLQQRHQQPLRERQVNVVEAGPGDADGERDPWAKAKAQQHRRQLLPVTAAAAADLTPCSRPAHLQLHVHNAAAAAGRSPARRPSEQTEEQGEEQEKDQEKEQEDQEGEARVAAGLTPCSSSQRPEQGAAAATAFGAAGAPSPAAPAAASVPRSPGQPQLQHQPKFGSPSRSHSRRSYGSSSHLQLQLQPPASPLRAPGVMDENAPPSASAASACAQAGWASPASAAAAAAAAAAFMSPSSRHHPGSAVGFLPAGGAALLGSPAGAAASTPGRRSARGTPRRLQPHPADSGAGPSGVPDSALLLLSSPGTLCRNPAAARCHVLRAAPAGRAAAAAAAGRSPSAAPAGAARHGGRGGDAASPASAAGRGGAGAGSSNSSSRRGSPAPAAASAGSLRRQVEVLSEDLEVLTAEVARRLASEAGLRRQLEEARMEGAAVASQVGAGGAGGRRERGWGGAGGLGAEGPGLGAEGPGLGTEGAELGAPGALRGVGEAGRCCGHLPSQLLRRYWPRCRAQPLPAVLFAPCCAGTRHCTPPPFLLPHPSCPLFDIVWAGICTHTHTHTHSPRPLLPAPAAPPPTSVGGRAGAQRRAERGAGGAGAAPGPL